VRTTGYYVVKIPKTIYSFFCRNRFEHEANDNDYYGIPTRSSMKAGIPLRCTLRKGATEMPVTEQDVMSALKSCYDPEIPVNIVDLGLIYNVKFDPAPEDKQDVSVEMTLTAQGCPEHVNISMQVKSRLEQLPGIRNAAVNVVWSPPWTPERLSPDARKQLGIE
jgi:metal-sulfur cluster biosynthetic enzyme